MKKTLHFILFLLCVNLGVDASPISPEKAIKIASIFLNGDSQLRTSGDNSLKISYVAKNTGYSAVGLRSFSDSQNPENLYYVVNRGENNGFVVIAGDDVVSTILAYSETGNMTAEAINSHPSIAWLFSEYENQIKYAISNSNTIGKTRVYGDEDITKISGMKIVVNPLLRYYNDRKTKRPYPISFGQDWPFNDLCPNMTFKDNRGRKRVIPTVSGCVATGISTVLRWHEWPDDPVGKVAYKWNKYVMSLDFDNGDKGETKGYDWKIMPYSVTGSGVNRATNSKCTEAEADQLARLLRDVGYSVKMNYGIAQQGGSGTQVYFAPPVLMKNFKYKSGCKWIQRDDYKKAEWMKQIIDELKNYGPIIYAGFSSGGGHCFNLDGYATTGEYTSTEDPDDYVHVDWGWNGMENGWYKLDILKPGSEGIGGGSGGYKKMQQMIRYLQPDRTTPAPEPTPEPTPVPPTPQPNPQPSGVNLVVENLNSILNLERNTKGQRLTVKIKNNGNQSFYGQKLYLVAISGSKGYTMAEEYKYIGKNTETDLTFYEIGFDLVKSDGNYELALASMIDGKKQVITNKFGSCKIYTKRNGERVDPVVPEKTGPVLSLATGDALSKGTVIEGTDYYRADISFVNSGDQDFEGVMNVYVKKKDPESSRPDKKVASGNIVLKASQKLNLKIGADISGLTEGDYNMYASYMLNGKEVFVKDYQGYSAVVGKLEITRKSAPTPKPEATDKNAQVVQDASMFYQEGQYLGYNMPTIKYYRENFKVRTYVYVNNGPFTGEIKVFITPTPNGTSIVEDYTYKVKNVNGQNLYLETNFTTKKMYMNIYYIGVMYRATGETKWRMMPYTHKPFYVSYASYYDYRGEYSDTPTRDKTEYTFEEPAVASIGNGGEEPERNDGDAMPTGIENNIDKPSVSVYPTVTSDNLNVLVDKSTVAYLVDMSGNILKTVTLSDGKNVLSLSDLIVGNYILKVGDKSFKVNKK